MIMKKFSIITLVAFLLGLVLFSTNILGDVLSSDSGNSESLSMSMEDPCTVDDDYCSAKIINSLVFEPNYEQELPRNLRKRFSAGDASASSSASLQPLEASQHHHLDDAASDFLTKKLSKAPNLEGIEKFDAMGSAQFSENSFKNAIKGIKDKIIVVDLRNEFHAFINGMPVSYYLTRYNVFNWNKTPEAIMANEESILNDMRKESTIKIKQLKKRKDRVEYINPQTFNIDSIESEKELVNRLGVGYVRFFVRDHNKPNDHQIDAFVDWAKEFIAKQKQIGDGKVILYFHCRGGKGRTSTFMALYDILLNADNVSLEDIVYRQHFLGGSLLSELPSVESYKYNVKRDRYNFIRKFYDYVKDPNGFAAQKWSTWKAQQ